MQGDSDKEISKVSAAGVGTEFAKLKEQAQARSEIQSRDLKYAWELRTWMEEHLKGAEERLTREIRTKVFLLSLGVVMIAVGAMLIGSPPHAT